VCLFINKKRVNSSYLRDLLFKYNVFPKISSKCGIDNNWYGKILLFELDHIDGNHNNKRYQNLRN